LLLSSSSSLYSLPLKPVSATILSGKPAPRKPVSLKRTLEELRKHLAYESGAQEAAVAVGEGEHGGFLEKPLTMQVVVAIAMPTWHPPGETIEYSLAVKEISMN
jgi:hypothetical protein